MKKTLILTLFVLSFVSYGQNPSKFPNGIGLPNATEQNAVTRIPVMDTDGNITGYVLKSALELALGNPLINGQILSSTTAGVRSWIDPPTGGGTALTFNAPLSETGGVVSFDGSAYVLTANLVTEVNTAFPNLDADNTDDVLISTVSPQNNITIATGTNAQLDLLGTPASGETRIEIATDGTSGSDFSGSWNDLTDIPAGFADNIDDVAAGGSGDGVVGNVALSGTNLNFSGTGGGFNGTVGLSSILTWLNLSGIPSDIADGDDDTQLTESEVDTFVANNGFITSPNDADSDPTNEIELPSGGSNGQILSTNGSGVYSWVSDQTGSAGISDGDYGDVTVSSGGTVITINDDAITGANVVNSTLNGSIELQNESVTSDKLAANSVGQSEISTNGVSIDEIDNSSNGIVPQIGQVPSYNGTDFTWVDNGGVIQTEGTFTPILEAGSTTPYTSTAQGYYVKTGSLVHIWIYFTNISGNALSGNLEVTGLPFNANVTQFTNEQQTFPYYITGASPNISTPVGTVSSNTLILRQHNGVTNPGNGGTDFTNGTIIINATYISN